MRSDPPSSSIQFLSASGKMGMLMLEKDWSKTPVGEIGTWPQSFRTALGIVLNANVPMLLFWHAEQLCFYNDTYTQTTKHALKSQGKKIEIALPGLWQNMKPVIDAVFLSGTPATADAYNYSAVYGEAGTIEGVIATCSEVRKESDDAQQPALGEERFRNTVFQAPVGITILRGPEFKVEMANQAYLELVDKEEKDFLNRNLFDALPEVKEIVQPLLMHVLESGKPFYATELAVILNRHGKKENAYFNLVYQPLRESNGAITGIMVVANEVTEQVNTKYILAQSEKEFRNVVMQSPIAMTVFRGDDMVIEMANKIMFTNIWRKEESDVIGKKLLDVFPELKTQQYPDLLKSVIKTGKPYHDKEAIAYVNGSDGMKKFYFDFECAPLFDTDNNVSGLMVTVNDVTEKVEAREHLKNSAERLLLATEGTQLATWDLNLKTSDMIHSPKLAEIFGFDRSKILSHKELRAHMHPGDMEAIMKPAFEKAMQSGIYYYEARVIRPDTTIRWLRAHGSVIFDTATKAPLRMLGTLMDITEQKLSKQQIEESEERLQIVIEASELGTWELNLQTDKVKYSQRYLEILGHSPGKVLEHPELRSRIHPDDIPVREAAFKQAYETGILKTYEFRIIWPDGSLHWAEAKGKLFYDEQHRPLKLVGTVRDITDIYTAIQEIKESEQKFRLLADSMPQHIWTGDAEGNLNYFNQSIYDYSGLSPAQILKSGWMQIVHPEDRDESIRNWAGAVNNGIPFLFEHRFKRADGEFRWQLSRAVPQKDNAGNIQMWVGTSTDVHDQKTFSEELEQNVEVRTQELKQAIEELVKTNQELEQFAYVSSHDLQEPLRKIQTFSSLLLEKPNVDPSSRLYLDKINSSASRMSDLIKDLLNYSRLSKTDNQFVDIDLNGILDGVKNDFEVLIRQKMAIIINTRLPVVRAIPIQMNQLIYNLIGNSLKFCEKKPFIEVTAKKLTAYEAGKIPGLSDDSKYYHLMFKDNGIGFSPEYKEQIFTIFQRLHEKQKYSGTGIGLAMCKKIVENHRGFISADSDAGKGATFNIFLPYLG
jgi:PAS domain S-box-containing protein